MRSWLGPLLLAVALAGCRQVLGFDDPMVAGDGSVADGSPDALSDGMPDAAIVVPDAMIDAGPSLPTLQFLGVTSSGADRQTYAFDDVAIGTPAPDRHLIVISHGRSGSPYFNAASLEIETTVATKLVQAGEGTGAAIAAVFIAAFPAGTTAKFELRYIGGAGDRRAAIAVWAAYGLQSALPRDTRTYLVNATNPGQVTLDVAAGGVFVSGVSMSTVPDDATSMWSGATMNYGTALVEASIFSGASASMIPTATPVVVTHSSNDTTTSQRMVAASFR